MSVPSVIAIGLVQMRCSEAPAENLAKAIAGIEEAAGRGAKIVCLQELFRTRYFCQVEDPDRFSLAEPVPGPTTEALGKVASARRVAVVASVFERRSEGLYHNTAVAIDADGSLVGTYRKMHVPDDPLYYEKFYFTPGDLGFPCFATRHARVGALVCWDQWFPEAARLVALAGAQILFYPTAIGWPAAEPPDPDSLEAWEIAQRAHAISNGMFVAVTNRVGQEGALRFWGRSFLADPFGRVLARGSASDEAVIVVECDLGRVEQVRREWPFLRDRRIDAYQELTRRFRD